MKKTLLPYKMRRYEIEYSVLVEPNFNQQPTPPSLVPAAAVVRLRKVFSLIIIAVSTTLGGIRALGQFVDSSTYSSPATPMSGNTPGGNIGVTFGVTVDNNTVGLSVLPDENQFRYVPPPDNPVFTSRYPMASYQNLNVVQSSGPNTAPVTETLVLQYSQPVNFANDLIFLDIGGSDANFDGPFIGTISATLGGVPVSTATWQFTALDERLPLDPVSYSWDASAGQFDVAQYFNSPAGILSSDPNTPFDTLTITYQTCSWDQYGIAQYAYPVPEPSPWALSWVGLLSMYCARGHTRLQRRRAR